VPIYDTLEQALDGLRDPQTFAELASTLLLEEHDGLVMGARTGDLGRDAAVQYAIWGKELVVIQYSLDRKWQNKIDRELKRYEKDPSLPKRMIYVTHLTATGKAQKTRVEKAAGLGVELRIYDRGWLWPRLQYKHRKLAEELIGLRPSLPGIFVEADEREAELRERIPGFAAPLIPTPGLEELREALTAGEQRVLMLVGPGGSGKTRAALGAPPSGAQRLVLQSAQGFDRVAAGGLDAYSAGVLLIDDAHRVEDLSGVRAMLEDAAWKNWTVVMTLRPGFAEQVLVRAGLDVDLVTEIAFGGLTRPQAAALLAAEPYKITLPELGRHLVELAQGNPLMLHLGADAAGRSGLTPQTQADLLRAYARRLRRSLPEELHGDLLSIAAFYGGLSLTEHLSLIRHLYPGAALPDIRAALADIADAGLGLTDGDTLTVIPDAVAPILVLDMLLQSGGHTRMRLTDLDLALAQAERERVLPIFAAAVFYGDGPGRDALRAFVSQSIPETGKPAISWVSALREARLYARALPREASRVLDEVLKSPEEELRDEPGLLDAAAEAARVLADASLPVGLPRLLSVVALASGLAERVPSSPGKTLSDLLQRAPSYGGSVLTDRTVTALRTTRAWLAEEPQSPARQRVALRVGLMLIAVTYEFVGASVADAMAIHIGDVAAPQTQAHRAAIGEAAKFAAALLESSEPQALSELGESYASLVERAAGPATPSNGELASRLRSMIRPAVSTVRSALLASWERLPVSARLRIVGADSNRRIASRAGADPEVSRLSLMFMVTPAGTPRVRAWEAQLRRARELGRELGPDGSLDLLAEALGQAHGRFQVLGVRDLLIGAGETASRVAARRGVDRMTADPLLRPYLGLMLAGALRGPGVASTVLRALAGEPQTAAQIVDVLDLVTSAEESRLTKLLYGQPVAHPALACHLGLCRRPADERAAALIELAEQGDTGTLGSVLEQFGQPPVLVAVPSTLRDRFARQMERIAREAALDRRGGTSVGDAFALVVQWGDEAWLEVLAARREALLADAGERRLWDLLPDDYAPPLVELSDHQRDEALPRLASWLEEADGDPLDWRIEHGVVEMLPRVGSDRPKLAAILGGWYAAGGKARERTLRLMSPMLAQSVAGPVLDVILANSPIPEAESELIAALSRPPMSWVGDLEEEYTKRADVFKERAGRGSRYARSFAQAAEAHLRRLAEAEADRTQQRKEGYGG
jgi:hypothetical protein